MSCGIFVSTMSAFLAFFILSFSLFVTIGNAKSFMIAFQIDAILHIIQNESIYHIPAWCDNPVFATICSCSLFFALALRFLLNFKSNIGTTSVTLILLLPRIYFFSFFIIINIECDVNLLIWVEFSEGSHNPFGKDFKSEIMIFSNDKSVRILKGSLTDYAL